ASVRICARVAIPCKVKLKTETLLLLFSDRRRVAFCLFLLLLLLGRVLFGLGASTGRGALVLLLLVRRSESARASFGLAEGLGPDDANWGQLLNQQLGHCVAERHRDGGVRVIP